MQPAAGSQFAASYAELGLDTSRTLARPKGSRRVVIRVQGQQPGGVQLGSDDYQRFFQSVPGRVIVVLPDEPLFTVVAVTSAYEAACLKTHEELIGRPLFEAFPANPADGAADGALAMRRSLREAIATKSAHTVPLQRYDLRRSEAEGGVFEERYWTALSYPILNERGEVSFVMHSVEDVTENVLLKKATREQEGSAGAERVRVDAIEAELSRRQGEIAVWRHELEEERTLLRLATEAAELGVFEWNIETWTAHWANDRMYEIFGRAPELGPFRREEFIGEILHPEDVEKYTSRVRSARRPGGSFRFTCRILRQNDRAVRWVEFIGRFYFSPDGEPQRMVSVVADVTERKRMEHELRNSEERLQQIFSQAPVAVAVLRGKEPVFELVNRHYQEMIPGRDVTGLPLSEVTGELNSKLSSPVRSVLETGEPFVANDCPVAMDRDGDGTAENYWFNIVHYPLRETNGIISGVVTVAVDVTLEVRARKELERANRELEEFAYVASHDLQEPLRMVNLYTQLLLKRFVPTESDEVQSFADYIYGGVKRMELLIRDLLDFSQIIKQENNEEAHRISSQEALERALEMLGHRIEETGAEITVERLPVVCADGGQITHVFQNLLANALKYRDPETTPRIRIAAERSGAYWVFSVADNGIGFNQRYAERIFGLFKRLHRDEYPGTGLGLAICKRIVERYGGDIWAESSGEGQGATFYFTLPDANGFDAFRAPIS